MTALTIEITDDLTGAHYAELINYAFSAAHNGYLVVQDEPPPDDDLRKFVSSLLPFVVSEARVHEWPGTRLLGGRLATMITFRATDEMRSLILRATDHLCGWVQPCLPEDFGFYDRNGTLLLDTVTHESSAIVYLDELRRRIIKARYPNLWKVLNASRSEVTSTRS